MSCDPSAMAAPTATTVVDDPPTGKESSIPSDCGPVTSPGNSTEWAKIKASITDEQREEVKKANPTSEEFTPEHPLPSVFKPVPNLNLYWGGQRALNDVPGLISLGITHILTVTPTIKQGDSRLTPFEWMRIPLLDDESQDMLQYFPITNEFISSGLKDGKAVFVHCMAGISRSVTCVIAYLIATQQMTPEDGLMTLKQVRVAARPNGEFLEQLQLYRELGAPVDMANCQGYQQWLRRRNVASNALTLEAPGPDEIPYGDHNAESATAASAGQTNEQTVDGNVDVRCRQCR